ncbi:unnamed protein product [Durusdinium trenchii]|uniref:TIR domain-containing protein n=1 Tax=Durusdinium trenchii TaxID=1381693 RepID=A0ABP0M9M2_9DINO
MEGVPQGASPSHKQSSWIVQELPTVGWVVKTMPGQGDTEAREAPEGAAGSPEPKTHAQDVQHGGAAEQPTVKLPGAVGEASRSREPTTASSQPDGNLRETARQSFEGDSQAFGSRFDAFVVYAMGRGSEAKPSATRAAAIGRALQARGLRVCQQSFLVGAVMQHMSSSDEAHFMAQAAQNSNCAVILLTRQFIDRVETGLFGDSCVAAFTLAKCLPNAVVVALEPELVNPGAWGWNQVFARFSGRAVMNLSMEEPNPAWEDAVDRLAWLLNPHLEVSRPLVGPASSGPLSLHENCPQDEEGGEGPSYDCFISHNWGKDTQGRDNHQRVMQIAATLEKHGIQVFLQDREAHRYSSTDEAMIDGMRRSAVALIFVTRRYIEKIEEGRVDDDCVAQFNLAKRAPAILPVVLEPEMTKISKWGWNRVYAHLSNKMLVDLSRGDVVGFPAVLWSAKAQRMQCAIDLLELRILQETYRLHPKRVQSNPALSVPHKDVVLIVAVCFAAAALSHTIVACGQTVLDGNLNSLLRVVGIVSGLFWIAGFLLHGIWLVMKARLPPDFEVHAGMIQPVGLFASIVRAFAWILIVLLHVVRLSGVEELTPAQLSLSNSTAQDFPGDFSWASIWGAHLFTAGCIVCCLDAIISFGNAGTFQAGWRSVSNLAGLAWVFMAAGAAFISISAQLEQDADVEVTSFQFPGMLFLLLASFAYLLWLFMHPAQLRRHFQKLAASEGAAALDGALRPFADVLGF